MTSNADEEIRRRFFLAANAKAQHSTMTNQHHILNRPGNTVRRRRRGSSVAGLLIFLGLATAIATTAVVFKPHRSFGAGQDDHADAPLDTEYDMVFEQITQLIGRTHAVIAVHPRGQSPFEEIVVWVADLRKNNRIDPEEIAVISHSRILHTITWYALDAQVYNGEPEWSQVFGPASSVADVASQHFCDRFRSHRDVMPRVIATGIREMAVETALPESGDADRRLLHIGLIWSTQTTDRTSGEGPRGTRTVDAAWLPSASLAVHH